MNRQFEQYSPRVTGWFGNEAPFAFTMPEQSYAETVWRYMGGTPAVALPSGTGTGTGTA